MPWTVKACLPKLFDEPSETPKKVPAGGCNSTHRCTDGSHFIFFNQYAVSGSPGIISVSKEGEYYLNGNKDDLEEIGKVFRSSTQLPRKPGVLVVADEDVPLKHVTKVVDLCRNSGLDDFRLQSR
jgi:hypothetical protein